MTSCGDMDVLARPGDSATTSRVDIAGSPDRPAMRSAPPPPRSRLSPHMRIKAQAMPPWSPQDWNPVAIRSDNHGVLREACDVDMPLRWTKSWRARVSVAVDLFDPRIDPDIVDVVFAVMALAPGQLFEILTVHPARAAAYLRSVGRDDAGRASPRFTKAVNEALRLSKQSWSERGGASCHVGPCDAQSGAMEPGMLRSSADGRIERLAEWTDLHERWSRCDAAIDAGENLAFPRPWGWAFRTWPLPNLSIGVHVETQHQAAEAIAALEHLDCATRFLHVIPVLRPIDLGALLQASPGAVKRVRVQGETGRGARPLHPVFVRRLRDACAAAEVPFQFNGWGAWSPHEVDSRGEITPPAALLRKRKTKIWRGGAFREANVDPAARRPLGEGDVFVVRTAARDEKRDLDGVVYDDVQG